MGQQAARQPSATPFRASHCSVSSSGHAGLHEGALPPAPSQPAAARRAARPRPRWQGSCLRACHSLRPSAARLATQHAGRISLSLVTTAAAAAAAAAAALTVHGSMTGLAQLAGLQKARAFVDSVWAQQNSDWCTAVAWRCGDTNDGAEVDRRGVRKSNSSARFWAQNASP